MVGIRNFARIRVKKNHDCRMVFEEASESLLALQQNHFVLLALRDVIEKCNKLPFLRTVDRNVIPFVQCFQINLELIRNS